jgi:hypothetical protein
MTLTKEVEVSITVRVTIDETKFDADFMAKLVTLDEHIEHLGWAYARGRADDFIGSFIEGYGPAESMGIKFSDVGVDKARILAPAKPTVDK